MIQIGGINSFAPFQRLFSTYHISDIHFYPLKYINQQVPVQDSQMNFQIAATQRHTNAKKWKNYKEFTFHAPERRINSFRF